MKKTAIAIALIFILNSCKKEEIGKLVEQVAYCNCYTQASVAYAPHRHGLMLDCNHDKLHLTFVSVSDSMYFNTPLGIYISIGQSCDTIKTQ